MNPVHIGQYRASRVAVALVIASVSCSFSAYAQLEPLYFEKGLTGLGLALRQLPTTGHVLYITAHPDDENNALLVWLRRGLGMRTGLLTLTRGEGGQNEIGSELFESLGILRTEELLAVQRFCGAEQYFSQAFEFGYSFSVEETFEKWGREDTLGDIVRVIRRFRPHVVLTLSPTGTGGGQHHQASALLAAEAFRAAADPSRFPEQLAAGLRPWQPVKLYRPASGQDRQGQSAPVTVSLGEMDRLLGESYAELGARGRSNHRCQGMNVLPNPGDSTSSYVLADMIADGAQTGGRSEMSLFDGIDTSLMGLMRFAETEEIQVPFLRGDLLSLQTASDLATQAFKSGNVSQVARHVFQGLDTTRKLRNKVASSALSADAKHNVLHFLDQKIRDFNGAANASTFVRLEALQVGSLDGGRRGGRGRGQAREQVRPLATDGLVTPGETFLVQVALFNQGEHQLKVEKIELQAPGGWTVEPEGAERDDLPPSNVVRRGFRVTVARDAQFSEPYWSRRSDSQYRYDVARDADAALPFSPAVLSARVTYSLSDLGTAIEASLENSVHYRWFDVDTAKERRMELKTVPALSVSVDPDVLVVPVGEEPSKRTLRVKVHSNVPDGTETLVTLRLPEGWSSSPENIPLKFTRENEQSTVRFVVDIPPLATAQDLQIFAEVGTGNERFATGYQTIAYHHIQTRHIFREAMTRVRAFAVSSPADLKVGYVMGVGDDVPEALEQLGAQVSLLGSEDLEVRDLNGYDVIITGVRAYKDRTDLIANNARLLSYVEDGGHLVVQYNKYEYNEAQYGPYPATINQPHDRVTDERSVVRVLHPEHPIFNLPNRITEKDWDGWVQERGLYFMGRWDPRYTPLVEFQDPFEYNNDPKQGALLVAAYGKGTFVYTGIGFFRQLPEGVAGAYRLFANLIGLKKTQQTQGN